MRHQTVDVLRGASLRIGPGETVAVVGRSGAGKSTLLHILGGLDRPDRGRVMLDGRDLYAPAESARAAIRATRIGFVFQAYHLLPDMTVLENVVLPALVRAAAASRRGARGRARALLERVGLSDRAAHMPLELSGGEQQRVALARALINGPDLVLADEPTGNLDERTGDQILDILFGMTRDSDRSLLLVTHNPSIAARCDRALRIEEGRVE
jgi:predicted ABC-type transport system involved in lysophospholipase L1 biosynthesis ATPase subunit